MDIETLLAGSARIDKMRKEISAIIKMVFGFLIDDEVAKTLPGETVLYQSDYAKIVLWYDLRDGLKVKFYRLWKQEEILVCIVPGNEISLPDVQTVHGHLNDFIKGMDKLFPSLLEHWRPLYQATKTGLQLLYELGFYIPSDDPLDDEAGKFVRYRKKCYLPFPLPLGTEVFVTLAGEPSQYRILGERKIGVNREADCFFEVASYEHRVQDYYGDLEETEFVMLLGIPDGEQPVHEPEKFVRLLQLNGWKNED